MSFIQNLVARALFPPCFNVWPSLGGYKPRAQYWDLDFEGRKPVLLSIDTPFSTLRAYYIPPLKSGSTNKVVVAYPGNTRAVGSLMKDFWSMFGDDVHLILVNPCGYGNFDEDRSLAMTGADIRLLEAWLRAIPQAVEEQLLEPSTIHWDGLDPHYVTKNHDRSIQLSAVDDLAQSFSSMQITVFGRSIGAFLASCHTIRSKIYYTPFQSVEKLEPVGILGLLWRLCRQFATFPTHPDNRAFLDSFNGILTTDQRRFINEYASQVFTGLETNLTAMLSDNHPCLLLLATEEDVVGALAGDFLEKVNRAGTASLITMKGTHNVLPSKKCKNIIELFILDTARNAAWNEREVNGIDTLC